MFSVARLKSWMMSGVKGGSVNVEKQHVAILAFPFGTHASPLLSLTRRIAVEAHKVTFSFFCTKKTNAGIFSGTNDHDEFLPNIKHYDVDDGLPEGYVPSGHPLEPIFLFIKAMPDNYKRVMDKVVAETGKNITCLVTDAFYWFGADLAKEMSIKWVPLWTAGPHSLFTHVYTDLIRQNLGSKKVDANNVDFLPGFPELHVSDLPEGVIDDKDGPFSTMLYNMGQALPQATAVAINSFATVHSLIENKLESKFKLLLNVGPFILTTPQRMFSDEHGCLPWLNQHEKFSVVYISFGSQIVPPPHELRALAECLEECGCPFIWVFKGSNPNETLPNGFIERTKTKGKFVAWAPQMEILKHSAVGLCLTHSGWNSVLDCIVGGVPMVSRPFFGDQRLNARMLESIWGIGVGVDNGVLTKESTKKALNLILLTENGKIMREKIVKLKESALKAVERNGTSANNFNTLIKIVTS